MPEASQSNLLEQWEYLEGKAKASWAAGQQQNKQAYAVRVPHSWNAEDTFREYKGYRRGWGSYRCEIDLAERPAGAAYLISEGFFGIGDVWINGKRRFTVNGNFVGFRFRVDPFLKPGKNWICLRLNNKHYRHVLPGIKEPDFVLHGGLAGRVWLKTHATEHMQPGKTRVLTEFLDDARARLEVFIPLCGECRSAPNLPAASLRAVLRDAEGREVARDDSEIPKDMLWPDCTFEIEAPRRWDVDDPYLYELAIEYCIDGEVVDNWHRKVGFRTTEWRPREGFFLNGRRLELRGVNRHEAMPGYGNALPLDVHRADAQLIKDTGFNLVRLSHYPQHPEFLRACDELGILVYAEIATWKSVRGGRWLKEAKVQMQRMVERDAYHASIILWGLGNESQHKQAFAELTEVIRHMDHTRATIYAENHQYRARRYGTQKSVDVMGVNYELDELEAACEESKNQVLLLSEMSNCPRWRGDEAGEAEQLKVLQEDLKVLENKPYVAGWVLWCLTDYATMRKKRYRRPSGVYDAWRRPKQTALWLREQFGVAYEGSDKFDEVSEGLPEKYGQ